MRRMRRSRTGELSVGPVRKYIQVIIYRISRNDDEDKEDAKHEDHEVRLESGGLFLGGCRVSNCGEAIHTLAV